MNVHFSKLFKIVLLLFSVILAGHGISVALFAHLPISPETGTNIIFDLFYFEHEKSITALYSGGLFIVLSMLFHLIAKQAKSSVKQWHFLKYIAIYLGCDEWFAIHDTIWNIKGHFLGIQYWIWIYLILFSLLALPLITFIKKMDCTLRRHLFFSGFVFILGAGVFETLNPHSGFNTLAYQGYLIIEDGLEMLGVIIAIFATMNYLKKQNINSIVLSKWPTITILTLCLLDLIITYNIKT